MSALRVISIDEQDLYMEHPQTQ